MAMVNEAFIDKWIADHKDEMIKDLGEWVKIPSVSKADQAAPGAPYGPECRKMLDFALAEGERYGFRTEDYEGYCGAIIYEAKKDGARKEENGKGENGKGENGKEESGKEANGKGEIGFVCHLDVVPEGDHWIYEPYNMQKKDDFLIGRGTGDNKGPGVMSLFLMRFFKENNIPLHNTLRLMVGCAEETGMADFKYYNEVLHGPVPAVSIVADAAFPVCYAQKGGFDAAFEIPMGKNLHDYKAGLVRNAVPDTATMVISGVTVEAAQAALAEYEPASVEALSGEEILKYGLAGVPAIKLIGHGKAGHAAFQIHGEKNNAIVNAANAAVILEQKCGIETGAAAFIADGFVTAFGDGFDIAFADEESGELTLNAGVIEKRGDILHLDIDIRYPVTMDAEKIQTKLAETAKKAGARLVEVKVARPYYIAPDDPKVLALLDSYREITGDQAKPYAMGGGTYSRVVPNAISFGPGFFVGGHKPDFLPAGHGGAHGPDEVLSITDWLTAFKIYILSVIRLDEVMADSRN